MRLLRAGWNVSLLTFAACAYRGPTQTAIDAAHVHWSRQGQPEAFQCRASAARLGWATFEVTCEHLTAFVMCSSSYNESCCTAYADRPRSIPESPSVCTTRNF